MRHYAIIGYPVDHSRSPELYSKLFIKYGVDADFRLLPVRPEEFSSLRALTEGLSGFAVTMPYKRAVIPYLDAFDDTASACGAVNIVERRGRALIGHNTDGDGLVDALRSMDALHCVSSAAILGRGGAAISAACSLKKAGVEPTLIVRSPSPEPAFTETVIENVSEEYGVFINATPLGMSGREDFPYFKLLDTIRPRAVLDMVYTPDGSTALTREAERRGVIAADGSAMLRFQALRAFRIWTGVDPD